MLIENNFFDCVVLCKNFLISYKGNVIMKKRGEDKRDVIFRWFKDRVFGGKFVWYLNIRYIFLFLRCIISGGGCFSLFLFFVMWIGVWGEVVGWIVVSFFSFVLVYCWLMCDELILGVGDDWLGCWWERIGVGFIIVVDGICV